MEEAKKGRYSFWVPKELTKHQLKGMISSAFAVHVLTARTQNKKGREKLTVARKKVKVTPMKKVVVTLKDKEKISLFEGDKK